MQSYYNIRIRSGKSECLIKLSNFGSRKTLVPNAYEHGKKTVH